MKYTIIEVDTDEASIISKICKELKSGIIVLPKGVINVIQFDTEEKN